MQKLRLLIFSASTFLTFNASAGAPVNDEQRAALHEKVAAYATCLKDRSLVKPITMQSDVDLLAQDCSEQRESLHRLLPNGPSTIEAKMKARLYNQEG